MPRLSIFLTFFSLNFIKFTNYQVTKISSLPKFNLTTVIAAIPDTVIMAAIISVRQMAAQICLFSKMWLTRIFVNGTFYEGMLRHWATYINLDLVSCSGHNWLLGTQFGLSSHNWYQIILPNDQKNGLLVPVKFLKISFIWHLGLLTIQSNYFISSQAHL